MLSFKEVPYIPTKVVYITVPNNYRAYKPDEQAIRVPPGCTIIDIDLETMEMIYCDSDHENWRMYFPVLEKLKYFDVSKDYTGKKVVFALETDVVVFNGVGIDIHDRYCYVQERRNGELPLLVEWRARVVSRPRRTIPCSNSIPLRVKVLISEARKYNSVPKLNK